MNNSKKKDLIEYKQTQPEQLKLFESEEKYSNTIELYDSMPKYYFGGVEREKGKNVDSLPNCQWKIVRIQYYDVTHYTCGFCS